MVKCLELLLRPSWLHFRFQLQTEVCINSITICIKPSGILIISPLQSNDQLLLMAKADDYRILSNS